MFVESLRRLRFRLRRGLESRGPLALAREAARRAFLIDERYVWYVLDLERVEPIALRPGYELHSVSAAEAEPVLEQIPAVPPAEGRRRVLDGVHLWVVMREREPAFACFVFTAESGPFPLEGARRGRYVLPPGVACLENGLTSRKFRGRGIAPAAWTAIAERMRSRGFAVLTTKVELDNLASRRTVEKTGFRPATIMHRRRRGFVTRVQFSDQGVALTPAERAAAEDLRRTVAR